MITFGLGWTDIHRSDAEGNELQRARAEVASGPGRMRRRPVKPESAVQRSRRGWTPEALRPWGFGSGESFGARLSGN